jgi:hypothetical protein
LRNRGPRQAGSFGEPIHRPCPRLSPGAQLLADGIAGAKSGDPEIESLHDRNERLDRTNAALHPLDGLRRDASAVSQHTLGPSALAPRLPYLFDQNMSLPEIRF